MVEEVEKSEDQRTKDANKHKGVRSDGEDDERPKEGGENVGDGDTFPRPAKDIKRHPLEHSWTFWFDNPSAKSKQVTWGSWIRLIYTFSIVEEFWSLYNNLHRPSRLTAGAALHCFKNRIEPKWEDPVCAPGGKWTTTFPKSKSDTYWLYTLLAMIGEQFDFEDEICGAVVNVRLRQEKIALWTKTAANEAAQMSIGKQWKEFLDYNDVIGFIFHEDAKKLDRGAKNKYST
ncbi:eukaryotic translation initiation factor 4E-1-like [Cynara cardunculus var. scolymus]|uniref:eukaryotic translation initiation factor 4E-1-like n=1 Tax=Cynara cardunculus var. scolymus TaxID=59895 RepID=UPI000D630721|nr:eukaryotic translation initiation factor 4E-1-like [Cynara cardunculus var. scolymus]